MTANDIIKAAIDDTVPEEKMSYADWMLYYRIQVINFKLKQGKIIKAAATEEKRKAIRAHADAVDRVRLGVEALNRIGELYKDLESSATAYRKERTLENADKLLFAFDGGNLRREMHNDEANIQSKA